MASFILVLSSLAATASDTGEFQSTASYILESMEFVMGIYNTVEKKRKLVDMQLLGPLSDYSGPCDWIGVKCESLIPHAIIWQSKGGLRIKTLDWLPFCLEVIHFRDIRIGTTMNSRLLPRDLWYCNMWACGLFGAIDLYALPENIEELHLRNNKFSGDVKVSQLPAKIRLIDIAMNPLSTISVLNKKLPEGLVAIHVLGSQKGFRVKCKDSKKIDKRLKITMQPVKSEACRAFMAEKMENSGMK